jgi:ATP-dependent Lon protease
MRVMEEIKDNIIPLLPIRGITIFPHMVLHFDVGRPKSILALEDAMVKNQLVFLVTQKDHKVENPTVNDIYRIGTISRIKQILKLPGDTIRVLVEGLNRAEIEEIVDSIVEAAVKESKKEATRNEP